MKKFYQKKVRTHCRILFLFAFSIFFMSCLNWIMEKPSFTLRGVTLSPISLAEMNLLLDLDVQNPNNFDLTLKSFGYTIYLKNEEIGNGRLEKELLIPSSSTTQIRVPLVAKFKDLSGSLKAIFTGDDLPYKIEGTADFSTVFGSLNFPFSKEGRINLKN
jgi:LEA14-like dessication related protein